MSREPASEPANTQRQPRSRAPAAEPADDPTSEPPRARSSGGSGLIWVAVAVAAVLLVVAVASVGIVGVAGLAAFWGSQPVNAVAGTDPGPVQPAPVAEPAPVVPDPAPPVGPATTFSSHLPDTKKVQVRCTGGQGEGGSEVVIAGAALGECTVIAVNQSRVRRTAVVKDVKPQTYTCFEGDSNECI